MKRWILTGTLLILVSYPSFAGWEILVRAGYGGEEKFVSFAEKSSSSRKGSKKPEAGPKEITLILDGARFKVLSKEDPNFFWITDEERQFKALAFREKEEKHSRKNCFDKSSR